MRVRLENVAKSFFTLRGRVDALLDADLDIREGEFFVLLGPSGCGKSTTLNLVAGLEKPTRGTIRFGERIVADPKSKTFVPPRRRDVAMVFQSYALYPHMNVFDNIAFPLKIAGVSKTEITERVLETGKMLGIETLLDRRPGALSGGQRQRVAIGRALVRNPRVFLLDEPLSNLDAQLRTATRAELKRLQHETGITTLYVTHDQTEAMTLGDRIALLNKGRVVQVGTPAEMYAHPTHPFTATFIGSPPMNLLPARIVEENGEKKIECGGVRFTPPADKMRTAVDYSRSHVRLGIRPEHIRLLNEKEKNSLRGRIKTIEPLGREKLVHLETEPGRIVVSGQEKAFAEDQTVNVVFDAAKIHLFPLDAGN